MFYNLINLFNLECFYRSKTCLTKKFIFKYAQHEWLKMATKKNTNAEAVEQFIDALESYSTQLMDTVMRNIY